MVVVRNGRGRGGTGAGEGESVFNGVRVKFGEITQFQGCMVVMVASQCKCTQCP